MRRKISPRVEARAVEVRAVVPASVGASSALGAVLAQARRLGLAAVVTIAPLGALAGSVSACGGAAPVRAYPYEVPNTNVPPVEPIAPPPAASASAAPSVPGQVPPGQDSE
jgi:hypothetical protein